MVSEGERERAALVAPGKEMVDQNHVTVGGRREGINTSSGPNGRISAALPPSKCGTAALTKTTGIWNYFVGCLGVWKGCCVKELSTWSHGFNQMVCHPL
jgi:hypothetical protein